MLEVDGEAEAHAGGNRALAEEKSDSPDDEAQAHGVVLEVAVVDEEKGRGQQGEQQQGGFGEMWVRGKRGEPGGVEREVGNQ